MQRSLQSCTSNLDELNRSAPAPTDCRESAALNYERKHFGDASKRGSGDILEKTRMRYATAFMR